MAKIKVTDLIPDDKNFNKGSEYGQGLIQKSFEKFGAGRSILIDKNNKIIAGNKSTENYGAGGGQDVIVVESDGTQLIAVKRTDIDLDTPQGREMALADNATAKANIVWAEDVIASEVGVEVAESWGVDMGKEVPEAEEDDFDATPPEEPITVLGDLYEIGDHRLLCGDSTDSDQVAKLMNGSKADVCISDPPYGISAIEKNSRMKQLGWEQYENDNNINTAVDAFNLAYSICDKLVFWGANHYANKLPNVGGWLIWDKQDGKDTTTYSMGELAWTNILNNVQIFKHIWDGFRKDSEKGESRLHPSQKPVKLHEWVLGKIEANLVLDLFLGSGSTMVASHQLKRKCYGMELDPKYCDVIIRRMINLDPTLVIKRNGEVTKEFNNG
jgi:DNA modification methylase